MPDGISCRAALSLGSNVGSREETILGALHAIGRHPLITSVRASALYETEPVGDGFTSHFINAACIVETRLDPRGLLEACEEIERAFGRRTKGSGKDRTLDIDIIIYADRVIEEPDLVIPHRAFGGRLFVLEPLSEIAAAVAVPPGGMTVGEIRGRIAVGERVRRISARSIGP